MDASKLSLALVTPTTLNKFDRQKLERGRYIFDAILRRDDIAQWRLEPNNLLFGVHDEYIKTTPDEPRAMTEAWDRWHSLNIVPGIQIQHIWETTPKNLSELAPYHGLSPLSCTNFIDTVVCDIIHGGLMVCGNHFKVHEAKAALMTDADEISAMASTPTSTKYQR
ncbi:hypothetical protein V8C34DRAFT_304573 [Trichoderma compactum]